MSIRQKFNEFKKEVKEVYGKDEKMKSLDITSRSVEELYNSFYFEKKIDSFLYINEFSEKDYNEFFYNECEYLQVNDLSFAQIIDVSCSIFELIRVIKNETIRGKLFYELLDLVILLKKEKINKN